MNTARNLLLCLALAVLAYFTTWLVDLDAVQAALPEYLPSATRGLFAVTVAISLGVFLSSAALALLVQSNRPWRWVFAYGALWFALALFPNVAWRESSHGASGIVWGSVVAWPAVLTLFACLVGARLALAAKSRLARRGT
jgi:hypothetical protein